MNNYVMKKYGVTDNEYKEFCKQENLPSYKREIREQFFKDLKLGKIIRDSNNKLIKLS